MVLKLTGAHAYPEEDALGGEFDSVVLSGEGDARRLIARWQEEGETWEMALNEVEPGKFIGKLTPRTHQSEWLPCNATMRLVANDGASLRFEGFYIIDNGDRVRWTIYADADKR